jgi:hypothetical protein
LIVVLLRSIVCMLLDSVAVVVAVLWMCWLRYFCWLCFRDHGASVATLASVVVVTVICLRPWGYCCRFRRSAAAAGSYYCM